MSIRTLLITAIFAFTSSVFALDTANFEAAKKLYAQRSYTDAKGIQNATDAAKLFDKVLPSAKSNDEKALVLGWIAQSYFTVADIMPARNDDEKEAKIPLFEKSYKSGEEALKTLGAGDVYAWDLQKWQQFRAKLSDEQSKIAAQATYYLASAYGQWGNLKYETSTFFGVTLTWRIPQLLRIASGLGEVDKEYYAYGSNRVFGLTLHKCREIGGIMRDIVGDSEARRGVEILAEGVMATLIPKDGVLVSVNGYNNMFLAEAMLLNAKEESDANSKADQIKQAKELLTNFVNMDRAAFEQSTLAETDDALTKAKALLATLK